MADSPISGKPTSQLLDEAVEAGASLEDIQGATKNAPIDERPVTEVQYPEESAQHIPYGQEFDDTASAVETQPPVESDREWLDRQLPDRSQGLTPEVITSPGMLQSIGWGITDYGLSKNFARWAQQALEARDDDATMEIAENIDELMWGVSEEYEEYIMGQPSLAAAQRESKFLRRREFRNKLRENESVPQALISGLGSFVLDPVNLVPGAVLIKGMNTVGKLATAAGMAGTSTRTSVEVAKWAGLGLTEELARNAPRLASDPTYTADQYITDATLGLALAPVIPLAGGPVLGAASKGARRVFRQIDDAAHAMGVDTAVRAAAETAYRVADQAAGAEAGIINRLRAVDPARAFREAKKVAKQQIDDRVREWRDIDTYAPIREAMDAGDTAALREEVGSFLNKLSEAIKKRADTSSAKLNEVMEKLRLAGDEALDGFEDAATRRARKEEAVAANDGVQLSSVPPKDPPPRSAGAAQRDTTMGDKIGDTTQDLKDAAKAARESTQKVREAAYAAINDAPGLREAAKRRLRQIVDANYDDTIRGVDMALKKRGIRPERTRLNNKDHTESVGRAWATVRSRLKQSVNRIKFVNEYDAVTKPRAVKDLPKNLIRAMNRAYTDAGIARGPDEKWVDAFERVAKGMSHTQRKVLSQEISDGVVNNFELLKQVLDADPTLFGDDVIRAVRAVDDVLTEISGELDLANVLARQPFVDATVTKAQWTAISEEWRKTAPTDKIAADFVDSKLQSATKHQFAHVTESLSSRLMKSEAPLAQWFTTHVLETPSGFGGYMDRTPLTAAIFAESLNNRALLPVLEAWDDLLKDAAKVEGWNWLRRVQNKQGNAKTHSDVTRLSREIMLEMNARHFGAPSKASPHVKKFADVLEQNYSELHDLQNGHVAGIHDGNKIKGYMHQDWDDHKILDLLGTDNGRKGLEDLFRQGYMNAGLDMDKAAVLAKAMIDQKAAAAAQPRGQVFSIGDETITGQMPELSEIVARMEKNGTPEAMVRAIVDHINKSGQGDMPGYAKSRTPVDLNASATINGETVQMVDLLNQDLPQIYTRYTKEATARRAISEATGGLLDSDDAMNDLLIQMGLEASELGASVDTRAARNALQIMMGRQYDGQLNTDLRRIRDGVALAGMGGLGESQLAEFGLALNRGFSALIGARQLISAKTGKFNARFRGLELTPEQQMDAKFLRELQESSGLFQDLYLVDRRNVHFDAQESNYRALSRIVDTATGGKYRPLMQHMQTRFSGYGVIRAYEDQIAMASIMQDIAKHFDGRNPFSSPERLRDLGVPLDKGNWLERRIKYMATRNDDGTIQTLNLNRWSAEDKNKLGVILNRYASQQVQKGFVGELSPELMRPDVAFLLQFKSYPLLAAEKQMARHLKFSDREAAMGVMLNAASSATARMLRYYSVAAGIPDQDKRKKYLDAKMESLGYDTLLYMGIGTPLTTHNFASDLMSGKPLPALNYMANYGKALASPFAEDTYERDMRNTQVAMPLGTIAHTNALFRLLSETTED
jgi:hypothetical protein